MLPNKLISQKPGGIMLFLALSEAIHCQTKRVPKIKLPVQPRIFQAFTSTAASCKKAKSDCMRSLSHRIFFAGSWAVERCLPAAVGRGRRSERCSVGNNATKKTGGWGTQPPVAHSSGVISSADYFLVKKSKGPDKEAPVLSNAATNTWYWNSGTAWPLEFRTS